jgi:predicted O-linked N-acetylglucosamine transferase (SPINDLY family)
MPRSQVDITTILKQGLALHQAGRLAEAEQRYRWVLQQDKKHSDALHLLGLVHHQRGQEDLAADFVARAIRQLPRSAAFHNSLGEIRRAQGRHAEAKSSFQSALRLMPDYAEAYNNLGTVLEAEGNLAEAERHFRHALELAPDIAAAHYNLGRMQLAHAQLEAALASFQACLALAPDSALAYNQAGIALERMGQWQAALESFRRAVELDATLAEAHFNLAAMQAAVRDHESAIESFRRGLRLDPNDADAYYRLADSLRLTGQFEPALQCLDECLKRMSDAVKAYALKADIYSELGKASAGILCAQRVLSKHPDDVDVLTQCADFYCQMGDAKTGVERLQESVRLHPENPVLFSSMLFHLAYRPEYGADQLYALHREWGERYARPLAGQIEPLPVAQDQARRLRVGYVSVDFKRHPVGFLLEPVMAHHDHAAFELVCYSNTPDPDSLTERFKSLADEWRDIRGKSDEEVADLVRADRIDILVDLNGHTSGNRLLVFARKPAPIQASWLGYFDTTGVEAIDYLIADDYSVPRDGSQQFAEEVLRLPHSRFCYTGPPVAPAVAPPPVLERGYLTFGSFNALAKLNEGVIALWARVLRDVPGSRLVLKRKFFEDSATRERFTTLFAEQGVEASRLELRTGSNHEAMLKEYGDLDIALDPFPYTGGMTTLEALWMGVPVVTLAGESLLGRQSGSFLTAIGLERLIAQTEDEYLAIVKTLAQDLPSLSALRAKLRPTMEASPLCDPVTFTRNLESAYRQMWQKFCGENTEK